MNRALFSSTSVHWATPEATYQALDAEFHFTFDPCPLGASRGLEQSWADQRVYLQSPVWAGNWRLVGKSKGS